MIHSTPTVFVVDDDEDVRELLCTVAQRAGLDMKAYGSAEAFWTAYGSFQPQCLVLDVQLPGISGLDLLRKLAAQEVNFPVIMMSGYADVATAVQAMRLGAKDFFQKPFNIQLLLERIRQLIEQYHKPSEIPWEVPLPGENKYNNQPSDLEVS